MAFLAALAPAAASGLGAAATAGVATGAASVAGFGSAIAGTALSLFSGSNGGLLTGLFGAVGANQQAEANAQIAEYNAQLERRRGLAEEERRRRESAVRIGALKAAVGKSGVTMEGTPLLILAQSAAEAEVDALNARWSANQSAQLDEMRARNYRTAGKINMGTSLLKTAGSFF